MNVLNYKVRHQQQTKTKKKVPSSIYIIQEKSKEREK